jgi:uncharacterized repeat protein (TIGR01451 family)
MNAPASPVDASRGARGSRRRLRAIATVIALIASALVVPLAAAQSADAAGTTTLTCSTLYGTTTQTTIADNPLYAVDPTTGNLSQVSSFTADVNSTGGFRSVNSLGIDPVTNTAFAIQYPDNVLNRPGAAPTVLILNATTGVQTAAVAPAGLNPPSNSNGIVMGAFSLKTRLFYFGALDVTTTPAQLWVSSYNPVTGAFSNGPLARVQLTGAANGDFAFDSAGVLYVTSQGSLVRVTQPLPTAGTGNGATAPLIPTVSIAAPPAGVNTNSMAFVNDGNLYISGNSPTGRQVFTLDPSTGAQLTPSRSFTPAAVIGDFAGCGSPPTLEVQKTFPSGRFTATDQVNVDLSGGGIVSGAGNHGTTSGTETGLQNQSTSEIAGPAFVRSTVTYQVSESAVGATNLANYISTWQCVDGVTGAVIASGTGTSGSVTIPTSATPIDSDAFVCTFSNVARTAAIGLVKSVSPTTVSTVGSIVTYSFVVTNLGTFTLTNPVVTETAFSGTGSAPVVSCSPGTVLAPAASVTCTATYSLTQADLDAGAVTNTARATATPPAGATPPVSPPSSAIVTTTTTSSIGLVKSATPTSVSRAGDSVTYSFVVSNTGTTTLTGVNVTDPTAGAVTCAVTDLAPGATVTCSADAVHAITQVEVDAGTADNTATAASADPAGDPVASPPSSTRTPVISTTGIALEKRADLADTNGNGKADIGEHIVYTFVVTNTGTKTLDTVVVNDPKVLAARLVITCPAGPLAPAASVTCVAQDWVVSSADIVTGGLIRNVATASARPLGQLRTLASPPSVADVPTPTPTPAALAFTGATVAVPVGIMLTLLTVGLALLLVRRRKKRG